MDMVPVSSSNLSFVGYDRDTSVLRIQFKHGIYDYLGVPIHIYEQLLSSPSKGKFHARYIKNSFPYQRVG